MWKYQPSQKANHVTKLRKGDRLVLLPSGEEARVRMAAKNSFLVEGHILALQCGRSHPGVAVPRRIRPQGQPQRQVVQVGKQTRMEHGTMKPAGRVDTQATPCRVCAAVPAAVEHPGHLFRWSVRCANSNDGNHRGVGYRAVFGKSEVGVVVAWNRKQKEALHVAHTGRKNYDEVEDRMKPRAFCKCGLSLPCNSCLVGTDGWQRHAEPGTASARVRMG
jgi:hypothetical protein